VLALTLAGCQRDGHRNAGGDQPLIAVAAPAETSNAALTTGRFALSGRCLVFVTSDGRTFLPVFGHRVAIAGWHAPTDAEPVAETLVLEEAYSVTGSPSPAGSTVKDLPDEIVSQCRYPPFAIGSMRRGAPIPPPAPPG